MNEEIRVAIVGSCVTRDAFEVLSGQPWQLVRYMARSHLGSFFGPRSEELHPSYAPMTSAFQQRTVQDDIEKRSVPFVRAAEYDVLVYDAIDDRYPVATFSDGGLATVSQEFLLLEVDPASYREDVFLSEAHFAHWERGWTAFMATLDEAGARDRLVYHHALWTRTVPGLLGAAAAADRRTVGRANEWLERALARARRDLTPEQVIEVPQEFRRADPGHRWGLSPYHYVPEYYQAFLTGLQNSSPMLRATN